MIFRLKQRGFTLIETMVVVAIISFLASMILFATKPARDAADNAYRIHTIEQYVQALYQYRMDHLRVFPADSSVPVNNVACLGAGNCYMFVSGTQPPSSELNSALSKYIPPVAQFSNLPYLAGWPPNNGIIYVCQDTSQPDGYSCMAPTLMYTLHGATPASVPPGSDDPRCRISGTKDGSLRDVGNNVTYCINYLQH